ncbi:MAG: phosphoribosylanthranilate isomerase [Candidatus Zixiibacteriota bacterium]
MRRTRIKFCGITRPEDARAAEAAGCDAVGVVLWPGSKRAVSRDQAKEIAGAVSPMIAVVGVFVSPTPEEVQSAALDIGLSAAQLSGPLDERGWDSVNGVRLLRVIGMNSDLQRPEPWRGLRDYVLDTLDANHQGGTGQAFDWSLVSRIDHSWRIWLAGGLSPENVDTAIRQVRPYGVDVSSGIESSVGIKSADLMQRFAEQVRRADESLRTDRLEQ